MGRANGAGGGRQRSPLPRRAARPVRLRDESASPPARRTRQRRREEDPPFASEFGPPPTPLFVRAEGLGT